MPLKKPFIFTLLKKAQYSVLLQDKNLIFGIKPVAAIGFFCIMFSGGLLRRFSKTFYGSF